MIYRKYGLTDKNISIISAGCMRFPHPEKIDEMALIPYEAAKHGINFFDTAPGYCNKKSEIILGHAIKEMKKSGFNYYISTKSDAMRYDDVLKDLEKSLKNLNVDHIDFMNSWYINTWHTFKIREKNGAFKALYKAKEEGLISHVVCSTHLSGDEIKKLVDYDLFEGIMLGFNAINFSHRISGIKAAGEKKMGVLTMNSLGGGIITDHENKFNFIKVNKEESIVRSALRFILSFKEITSALLGFRSINDVNIAIKAIENLDLLNRDQIEKIKDNVINSYNSLCTMCGYCRKVCKNNIPIPELMESFNYLILYRNPLAVKSRLEIHWSIKELNNILRKCEFCGKCELKCTQKLPIMDRLYKLTTLGL